MLPEQKIVIAQSFTQALAAVRRTNSRLEDFRVSLVVVKEAEVQGSISRLGEMQRELDKIAEDLGKRLP